MATSKKPLAFSSSFINQVQNPKLNLKALKRPEIRKLTPFIELTPAKPEIGSNFLDIQGATTISKDPENYYAEFIIPQANYKFYTHYVAIYFDAKPGINHYMVEYDVEVKPKNNGAASKYYFSMTGTFEPADLGWGAEYIKGQSVYMEIPALMNQSQLVSSINMYNIPEDPTTWLLKRVRVFFIK